MSGAAAAGVAAAGRIGPNAITRVAEVLPALAGAGAAERVFARAGLLEHLQRPPQGMVDETEVARLHATLHATLGDATARAVARAAGTATGDYLLAHRIPHAVQWVLKRLPAALAARVLLSAISRHAWTFAGSGRFAATPGRPVRLEIRANPMCRGLTAQAPACDFYAATFERLFRVLVHPAARAVETACEACGDDACRFELRW